MPFRHLISIVSDCLNSRPQSIFDSNTLLMSTLERQLVISMVWILLPYGRSEWSLDFWSWFSLILTVVSIWGIYTQKEGLFFSLYFCVPPWSSNKQINCACKVFFVCFCWVFCFLCRVEGREKSQDLLALIGHAKSRNAITIELINKRKVLSLDTDNHNFTHLSQKVISVWRNYRPKIIYEIR